MSDGGHPQGEHPGSVCPECHGPDAELEFAAEHVEDIHAGRKTATVRYGDDGAGIGRGDTVELVDEDGTPIRMATITRTAACYAIEAFEVLGVYGARYPAESPSDVVSGVNKHYDAPVRALTDVQVLCWGDEGADPDAE